MAEPRSVEDFLLDIEAQLERAQRCLISITAEFEKAAPGDEISRAGRIETKEFIGTIKHVLDQVTVRVWQSLVSPGLPAELANKRLGVIYYPYASDEQMYRSALGKMVDIKAFDTGSQCIGEEMFAAWLRAMQPIQPTPYGCLYTIGKLSRLPHQKLIEQRKSRLFVIEAFSENGGGASMRFKNKPGRFTLWTYKDKYGASTGIGGHPIPSDPDAELTVFTFEPETMDFNKIPGAKTSVLETMECHVEDMEFDALPLFQGALWSVAQIARASAFLFEPE